MEVHTHILKGHAYTNRILGPGPARAAVLCCSILNFCASFMALIKARGVILILLPFFLDYDLEGRLSRAWQFLQPSYAWLEAAMLTR